MADWKQWAKDALELQAKVPGAAEDKDAHQALLWISENGYEPYHTLKGYVNSLQNAARMLGVDD